MFRLFNKKRFILTSVGILTIIIFCSACFSNGERAERIEVNSEKVQGKLTANNISAWLTAGTVDTIWQAEVPNQDNGKLESIQLSELNEPELLTKLSQIIFPSQSNAEALESLYSEFSVESDPYSLYLYRDIEAKNGHKIDSLKFGDLLMEVIVSETGMSAYKLLEKTEIDSGCYELFYGVYMDDIHIFSKSFDLDGTIVPGTCVQMTITGADLSALYIQNLGVANPAQYAGLKAANMAEPEKIISACEDSLLDYGCPVIQIVQVVEPVYYPKNKNGEYSLGWLLTGEKYLINMDGNISQTSMNQVIDAISGKLIVL